MKVTKLVIENDEGVEEVLIVKDGAGLFVCEGETPEKDKILTTSTMNPGINLQIVKNILGK